MRIQVVSRKDYAPEAGGCLVLPLFQEGLQSLEGIDTDAVAALRALIENDVFRGKAAEAYFLPTPGGAHRGVIAVGLGKRDAFNAEVLRRAGGKAASLLQRERIAEVVFDASANDALPTEAFIEGVILAQYCFNAFKSAPKDEAAPVVVDAMTVLVRSEEKAEAARLRFERAVLCCRNANWARDLANTPSNRLTPAALADAARAMARETGCSIDVLDEAHMERLGMHALLGVAKGSENRACLIVVQHRHAEGARTLAVVGKGITFDTGGISIKPPQNMHEMKYDMSGAAAALATVKTAAELKLPINVVCVVPAAENMPGGNAQKPGDIVTAYNGKTIEVDNTDAEGRLILADALAYTIEKFHPDRLVDLATLTGGVVVALGHYAAGLLTDHEALYAALQRASDETGERVWRLPMWSDYDKLIEGNHAELNNVGPPREASTIVGGCFLRNFVGDTPWAHLDIAGTAFGVKNVAYLNKDDATGFGVRLLAQWLTNEAENTQAGNGGSAS